MDGECGSTSLYGGLGAMPPVGSRGNAPGGGSGGEAPLKLTTFLHLPEKSNGKNCTIFSIVDAMNKAKMCKGTLLNYADRLDKFVNCLASP